MPVPDTLEFYPLTKARWRDYENLFGPNGAYSGCWCMWWRQTRNEFDQQHGEGNRCAMKAIVEAGGIPGILAYSGGVPVGWCSVAPRDDFASLNRSHVLKSIDNQPVWSIVCFFVAKSHRGQGVMESLVRAALEFVRQQGGSIVEAYPSIPKVEKVAAVSSFMGFPSMFEKLGFELCATPSASKKIMRYHLS